MSKHDDGNAAFPMPASERNQEWYGMSLRDYLAAKAMQGILAGVLADGSSLDVDCSPNVAHAAYKVADAMLSERAK